jgi:hypothetical protein
MTERPLPRVTSAMCTRIAAFLDEKWPSTRPRTFSPGVLAMIVELHLRDRPYPGRVAVAEALGGTKDGVDAVVNAAKARGLLTVEVRLVPSHNKRTESTRQVKHLVPSADLLAAATRTPIGPIYQAAR